jgi:hypothetical protein
MVYTVVDDWYQAVGWQLVRSRPGVKPRFSDSEVLTLEVVRELEGETRERRWYARVAANWRALFPCLPERSVLHKRTKSLGLLLDRCRCGVRDRLVNPADPRRLLDGTPVPVCAVSRVGRPDGTSAGRQWPPYGAQIGRCAARAWWEGDNDSCNLGPFGGGPDLHGEPTVTPFTTSDGQRKMPT